MSELLNDVYAPFILSSYGITAAVLIAMVLWVWLTARRRTAELDRLEAEGLRRAARNADPS